MNVPLHTLCVYRGVHGEFKVAYNLTSKDRFVAELAALFFILCDLSVFRNTPWKGCNIAKSARA